MRPALGFLYSVTSFVLVAIVAWALLLCWPLADAAPARYLSAYPSVEQLQMALNAYPGAQIPAKEVVMNNRIWTAWYVGARAIGGGRYAVIVQLRANAIPY